MTKQMLPMKPSMHKHRTATEEQPWNYSWKTTVGFNYLYEKPHYN